LERCNQQFNIGVNVDQLSKQKLENKSAGTNSKNKKKFRETKKLNKFVVSKLWKDVTSNSA